jgi:hypothetical protein
MLREMPGADGEAGEPAGLADALSPVDLPEPASPLPHPLGWTSKVIAAAVLVLVLFNAHAIRGWSYQLPANAWSARVVGAAEGWHGAVDRLGFNRPVAAMHGWWLAAKAVRFRDPQASPEALSARAYSSSAIG